MVKDKEYNFSGFIELLQLMFIYLKLTKQINWSWWWVLSPLWIVVVLAMILGVIDAVYRRLS